MGAGGVTDMKRKQGQEQPRGRMPGIVTVAKSACDYLGIDYDIVFKPCRRAAGSSIEAIVLLMEHMRPYVASNNMAELSPDDISSILDRLSNSRNKVDTNEILRHVWSNMRSSQLREFLQAMYQSRATRDSTITELNADAGSVTHIEWFTIIHATRIGGSNTSRFSDYVLGMRIDEDELTASSWVPIGKVKGRPPQALASQLDALLAEAVMERFGPTVSIKPGIMVEVRHRGYRENPRIKAGKVLAEPEVVSISPGNAN
jgi:hypothetical protein